MEKKTIYLLDGTNLLYRAFFAIRMLNSPSGQPSNAVYGMGAMLLKLIEDYKPDGIVVAFDKGKETFRSKLYSEYKGTRQETPVELREQFEPAKELIRLLDIPMIESDEYETLGLKSFCLQSEQYDLPTYPPPKHEKIREN